ncbi:hypothetical protein TIFTF001_037101 [Ficus carica]|uniref:Uncharacterized protein n=1 Tax=Ficus carica TaxID=3494 RepID=A0AA88E5J3_FICCA|nr:hypothetical protein TIFTF001_037101 [Ficus carica]
MGRKLWLDPQTIVDSGRNKKLGDRSSVWRGAISDRDEGVGRSKGRQDGGSIARESQSLYGPYLIAGGRNCRGNLGGDRARSEVVIWAKRGDDVTTTSSSTGRSSAWPTRSDWVADETHGHLLPHPLSLSTTAAISRWE